MHQATRLASLLALSLTLAGGTLAQAKERPKAASAPMATPAASGAMGCGMMTPPDCEKRQEEMKKIRETKDPVERQKRMDKHHKEMHDEHMGKEHMGKGGMGMGMGASAPMAASK